MFLSQFSGVPTAAGSKSAQFAAAFTKAVAAGLEAGKAAVPRVMVVQQIGAGNTVQQEWHEPEGLCGFAWVKVTPGNSPFANWLKRHDFASKAYGGGVDIWISDFNQSVTRKEAAASALAKVLQMELGIHAYASSRLD